MTKFDKNFIQYSTKKVKSEKRNLGVYLFSTITMYILLLFATIFLVWYVVFASTHSFYVVSGPSMMPTLNNRITYEQVISEKAQDISYDAVYIDRTNKIKLFDIVVIERQKKDSVIKRVMAQEGDYITIALVETENGKEYRFFRIPNGTNLEKFTDQQARMEEQGENGYVIDKTDWLSRYSQTALKTVEGNENGFSYQEKFYDCFLNEFFRNQKSFESEKLFDYTIAKSDSNEFLISPEGLVYVKVPKNKFFYMGDNRGHSTDAREHGFCDVKYIVGRTELIVYNHNFVNRILEVMKFYFNEIDNFFAR